MSNQAVGGTMEHNPISIIPPATASRGQRQFKRVIEKKSSSMSERTWDGSLPRPRVRRHDEQGAALPISVGRYCQKRRPLWKA